MTYTGALKAESSVPCSLFPVPCSLFPVPCSLFPVPCSLDIVASSQLYENYHLDFCQLYKPLYKQIFSKNNTNFSLFFTQRHGDHQEHNGRYDIFTLYGETICFLRALVFPCESLFRSYQFSSPHSGASLE